MTSPARTSFKNASLTSSIVESNFRDFIFGVATKLKASNDLKRKFREHNESRGLANSDTKGSSLVKRGYHFEYFTTAYKSAEGQIVGLMPPFRTCRIWI